MGNDYILKRIGIKRKSKKIYLKGANSVTREVTFVRYPDNAEIFTNVTNYLGSTELEQKLKEFEKIYGISIRFVRRDVEICKYYESGNG